MTILNMVGGGGKGYDGPYPEDYSAIKGPCPDGFHIPTNTEGINVNNIGIALGAWTSSGGTNLSSYLKMPICGYRNGNSVTSSTLCYWYCTGNSGSTYNSYILNVGTTGNINANANRNRGYGCPIRPFKDIPIIPDSNWTILYQGTGSAGIYHNSSLGLISLSSDGTTRITIADKNLGATQVWNSGDALTDANCGYYYQWGNNYGFPHSGNVSTSDTRVDASTYGPGNYYSSSTYITYKNGGGFYLWDSSYNTNLWGGDTGVTRSYVIIDGIRYYKDL